MQLVPKIASTLAVLVMVGTAGAAAPPPDRPAAQPDAALLAKARAIHGRVLALDTHVDIDPVNFELSRNYTQDLETQVTLPKMKAGGLDAAFFIVYVAQGPLTPEGYDAAYRTAIEKFDAIHRLTQVLAPGTIELARTAADVRRIHASGKKVALIGIENGYPIGTDISRVKEFYDRGGRYLSLAHNGHSQLADSNSGEANGVWLHNGLSELGRQVVAEANKWGIMLDLSHPSKAANLQVLELTKAPVIASHSSVRALCNHSRNMDDEQLEAVKKNGGVVQIVALSAYVKEEPTSPARTEALAGLNEEFGLPQGRAGRSSSALARLSVDKRRAYAAKLADIDTRYPPPPHATVGEFVDHVDYVAKKIGIDHVGIASDFDGGGGIQGWEDASETLNVTVELVRRGYSEAHIAKIWGGNLLRVMERVADVAAAARKQPQR